MPPTRPMKQSKLSFNTRRSSATNNKKKQKVNHAVPPVIDISSDEELDDVDDIELPTSDDEKSIEDEKEKTAVSSKASKIKTGSNEEQKQPQGFNPKDPKFKRLYDQATLTMGTKTPIHAAKENRIQAILRVFDLSYEYGPCVGVSRLQRWQLADEMGLNPPPEIKEILMTAEGSQPLYSMSTLDRTLGERNVPQATT